MKGAERIKTRVRVFFEAYGVKGNENGLLEMVLLGLEGLSKIMKRKAGEGDQAFKRMIDIIKRISGSFVNIGRIDRESIQKASSPMASPIGRYTADAFYELYGGAAGGVNVWIEVTDHNNHDKIKKRFITVIRMMK